MSACSRQIPAVRLVGSVARAVEPDSGSSSSSSQHCTRDEGDTGGVIVLHRHIGSDNTWYAHKACVGRLVFNVFYLAILNSNCF